MMPEVFVHELNSTKVVGVHVDDFLDALTWARDNLKGRFSTNHVGCYFNIEDKQDAMIFKLMWKGDSPFGIG